MGNEKTDYILRSLVAGVIMTTLFCILVMFLDPVSVGTVGRQPMLLAPLFLGAWFVCSNGYLIGSLYKGPVWARAGVASGVAGLTELLVKGVVVFLVNKKTPMPFDFVAGYMVTQVISMVFAVGVGMLVFEAIKPPAGYQPSSLLARRAMFLVLIAGMLHIVLASFMGDDYASALLQDPQLAALVCVVVGIDAGISFLASNFLLSRVAERVRGNLVRILSSLIAGAVFLAQLNLLRVSLGLGQIWDVSPALPVVLTVIVASWPVYGFVTEAKPAKRRR